MRCCLIVATIGRTGQVEALLKSLADQRHRVLRVVLVDQNEDERLVEVVRRATGSLAIEHVRISPHGVSAARNAGLVRLGDAELVAFPDDDCVYDPDTLATVIAAMNAFPQAQAVMAALHLPKNVPKAAPKGARSNAPKAEGSGLSYPNRFGLLHGSNTFTLFFRRSRVDAVGGFDETLGPGAGTPWLSGEDTDYLVRAFSGRGSILRCPSARVYHPAVDATSAGYQAKAFGYGRGRIQLLRKHRYPRWFVLANVLHPLLRCVFASAADRAFRWHLFRGRWHEWTHATTNQHSPVIDVLPGSRKI